VVLVWARRRLPRRLGEGTLLVDLVSIASFFAVLARFDASGEAPRWTLYILPALMMATLLSSFLRYSRRFAIVSSAVAAGLLLAVVVSQDSFHPAQLSTAAIMVLSGFIAASSGARARQNLDTFARLRDMLEALEGLNRERERTGLPPLRMGMGWRCGQHRRPAGGAHEGGWGAGAHLRGDGGPAPRAGPVGAARDAATWQGRGRAGLHPALRGPPWSARSSSVIDVEA
jgi:hypothetical protein